MPTIPQTSEHRLASHDSTDKHNMEQHVNDLVAMVHQLVENHQEILQRMQRIEKFFGASVVKEAYTTEEVAERLGRSEWTVRQWCNHGQVTGAKKVHGRGRQGEWRIPHEELVRLQNEGPLPIMQRAS
jgi:predicted transcriptional regulator